MVNDHNIIDGILEVNSWTNYYLASVSEPNFNPNTWTPQVPLMVADSVQSFTKTKQALEILKRTKTWADVAKAAYM